MRLTKRDLLSVIDFSKEEILEIFELTKKIKRNKEKYRGALKNKILAMIFEKPSTRTRISFEVAIYELGGYPINLSVNELQLGRGESIPDTARTVSRYVDGVMIRAYRHENVVEFAKYSSVPVINGLTDLEHPCQAITDFYTILEKKNNLKGLKIVYIGDGNNVANSLLLLGARLGVHIVISSPKEYQVNEKLKDIALKEAKESGAVLEFIEDPKEAIKDADIVYTDVWTSMGKEHEREERERVFARYQVNQQLFSLAKPDALFMHCLPALRGKEVTDEVIDSPNSIVFDQAENRLHVQKAILIKLLG